MRRALTTGEHRCAKCHRLLRAPRSVRRSYGPTCWGRVLRSAAVADASGVAVAVKAAELLTGAALVHLRRDIFQCPSGDGSRTYLCCPRGCSCPAGVHVRFCAHRFCAAILAA